MNHYYTLSTNERASLVHELRMYTITDASPIPALNEILPIIGMDELHKLCVESGIHEYEVVWNWLIRNREKLESSVS